MRGKYVVFWTSFCNAIWQRSPLPVVGVGEDGGKGLGGALAGLVEHLALQLGELVLEVGVVVGQGLHDAGVDRAVDALVGGAKVLGAWKEKNRCMIFLIRIF